MNTPLNTGTETLIIDPVAMQIVNRLAAGTALGGEGLHFEGGLLLQGRLHGSGEIAGKLVVWHGGLLQGRFRVLGDLYVFGRLGLPAEGREEDPATQIECQGTVHVASCGMCTGALSAPRLRLYEGGVLQGPFRTLKHERSLPVLGATA